MPQTGPFNLASTFLRLRADVSAEPLPVDESFWQRLSAGELGDFHNEYLVTMHSYDRDWAMWEMHPNGDEIVCLVSGATAFVLETPNGRRRVDLIGTGSYVIVPKGTWHTAKASEPCCLLFITPGEGTQHRTSGESAMSDCPSSQSEDGQSSSNQRIPGIWMIRTARHR